jgi:hypothetical protein
VPPFDRHDWVVSRKYPDVLVEDGNKLMQSEVSNPTELINSPCDDSVYSKSEKITESHHLIPEKFKSRDTLNTVNSEATINYTRSTIKSVNGDVGESFCGRGFNSD